MTVQLFVANRTSKAIGCKTEQKRKGMTASKLIWIPRSQITNQTTENGGANKWDRMVAESPDWLASRNNLQPYEQPQSNE